MIVKTYEKWDGSDLQHRNAENAKKLHAFKNILDQKVKQLEAIIIIAGQALEKELLNLGYISQWTILKISLQFLSLIILSAMY